MFQKTPISSEAQHERMLHTPIPKLVTQMAVPTILTQLISIVYNTADTYFVSQLSTSASAAVGVVFSLMSIIQALGYGFGMGSNSIVSRCLGKKDNDRANCILSSAFFIAMVMGMVMMVAGLLITDPLMRLLGATETILPYAADYARIILIAAPVMCPSFVLASGLRGEGQSKISSFGVCAGGLLNLALDPLFIFTFRMGIAGAALATALSQLVSFLILLSFYLRRVTITRVGLRYCSRKFADYWEVIRVGFPTICRQGFASLASALSNNAAAAYGDAAIAAVTIAYKVYLLARSVIIGIGQGFQPVAGYNFGAGDKKRTRQAFRFTVILGTAVCIVLAAVIACIPGQIMQWFRDDAQVVAIGRQTLLFACAVMPLMAYSTYVNQLYQSLGFAMPAAFLASCRQGVFYIPLVLILPRLLGLTGVELVQSAADFLTFVVSIPFQIRFYRRVLRVNSEEVGVRS